MLQQTRVAAALPYYERFLARFPNLESLAAADETDLLAQWAGLGYYYRARNLQKAAQLMCDRGFPATYEEIRALPGIGDYTAAAVASIAFDLPHAVLDGNVFRVLSRISNDATNIASTAGRTHFAQLAHSLLDCMQPGAFNQALMELGATICLPSNPQCLVCPVATLCRARAAGTQRQLPVKIVGKKNHDEHRDVFWIEQNSRVLAWQRPAESRLMPGFWELPERAQLEVASGEKIGAFRHTITFHNYRLDVLVAPAPPIIGPCVWIPLAELSRLPVSTILKKAWRLVQKHRARTHALNAATSSA